LAPSPSGGGLGWGPSRQGDLDGPHPNLPPEGEGVSCYAPAEGPSQSAPDIAPIEQVVAIEGHDLVPRRHEVAHELLLRVVARVDLRQRAKLGVRAEDEVGCRRRPSGLA